MPALVGNDLGQASALWNNYEQNERNAVAQNYNVLLAQRNAAADRALRATQMTRALANEAANRQAQLDMFHQQMQVEQMRYGNESNWRQRQLDLEERQLKDQEDSIKSGGSPEGQKKNAEEFNEAAQIVEDPNTEFNLTKYPTLTEAQKYTLGQRRKSVLSSAMSQYQSESDLATMQNELADLNRKIPQGFDPNKPPPQDYTPTRLNPLNWLTPSTPNPDYATFQGNLPLYQRRQSIVAALQPYEKNMGGVVRVDPQTGRFSPAMVVPAGGQPYSYNSTILTPNRGSVAGAMGVPTAPPPIGPAQTASAMVPMPVDKTASIAPTRTYRDKSGTRWRYIGKMGDPMKDQNPDNWEKLTSND